MASGGKVDTLNPVFKFLLSINLSNNEKHKKVIKASLLEEKPRNSISTSMMSLVVFSKSLSQKKKDLKKWIKLNS